jgi:MFS family permease
MYYIGILIHGLIFGFFYVGGQIYIDKKAPIHLKSQAQGFIFLVTFGAGLLVGNFISAKLIDLYKTDQPVTIGMPFGELPRWFRWG